jgi:hypothetical protein
MKRSQSFDTQSEIQDDNIDNIRPHYSKAERKAKKNRSKQKFRQAIQNGHIHDLDEYMEEEEYSYFRH